MSRASLEAAVDNEEFFKGWDRHWLPGNELSGRNEVLWLEGPVYKGQEHVACSIVDFGEHQIWIESAKRNVTDFLAGRGLQIGVMTSKPRTLGRLEGCQLSEEPNNDAQQG
jgi:hypothetical protein